MASTTTPSIYANPDLDVEARLELITQRLEGVQDADKETMREVLMEKQVPSIDWLVAPTGRPHIGYLLPFVKLAEFVEAGLDVTVGVVDNYAYLVNYKWPREIVELRTSYYKFALSAVFEAILGVPATSLQYKAENDYLTSKEHILDFYRLLARTTINDARGINEELGSTAMLSPLVCPILQVLDEHYIECDFQLGGVDQIGYYEFAKKYLPQIGYGRRHVRLANTLMPGLTGTKMSASDPQSKIDLLDPPDVVNQKIAGAVCDRKMLEENPILSILKHILVPISKLRLAQQGKRANISRLGNFLPFVNASAPSGAVYTIGAESSEPKHYKSYEEIESDFQAGNIPTETLKHAVAENINQLLQYLRNSYEKNPEWQAVMRAGYLDVEEPSSGASGTEASEHFCIPAARREVSNECVKLVPFVSNLHAIEFIKIAKDYPEMWKHVPMGPFPSAQSFIADFIEGYVRPNTGMLLYAIIDKTKPGNDKVDPEGALAGYLSLLNTSTANQSTEIGWVMILPPFHRTHVTSNACGLLLNLALNSPSEGGLGLRRVQWQTSSANSASIATAKKLGFTYEGTLRWDRVYQGGKMKGKADNGKSLRLKNGGGEGHLNEDDVGRDTVVLSMCWDDWFNDDKREFVRKRMAGEGDAVKN